MSKGTPQDLHRIPNSTGTPQELHRISTINIDQYHDQYYIDHDIEFLGSQVDHVQYYWTIFGTNRKIGIFQYRILRVSSFLLEAMPFNTSSFLAPSSDALCYW